MQKFGIVQLWSLVILLNIASEQHTAVIPCKTANTVCLFSNQFDITVSILPSRLNY